MYRTNLNIYLSIYLMITYLSIYRTNIDHKRATKLYDMPRLLRGSVLVYSLLPLFFSLILVLLSIKLVSYLKINLEKTQ